MSSSYESPIAYLIRHGKDTLSSADVFVSWADVPLTIEGRAQAQEVKEYLRGCGIVDVYSSPLQRCLYMAEDFTEGKMPIIQSRSLLPFNRGILTGIPRSEAKEAFKLFLDHPDVRIPLGESRVEAESRIEELFVPALKLAETRTAAFFTHHSVVDLLNALLTGERGEPKNLLEPAGIAAVYVDGNNYRMEALVNAAEEAQELS